MTHSVLCVIFSSSLRSRRTSAESELRKDILIDPFLLSGSYKLGSRGLSRNYSYMFGYGVYTVDVRFIGDKLSVAIEDKFFSSHTSGLCILNALCFISY